VRRKKDFKEGKEVLILGGPNNKKYDNIEEENKKNKKEENKEENKDNKGEGNTSKKKNQVSNKILTILTL
jgi:hypothetical protein